MSHPMPQNRHSIRIPDYDYSQGGAYFVTLVTYHRLNYFGESINGKIELNTSGRIAFDQWVQLGNRFKHSDFSIFVVMPNHIHGIILLGVDMQMESEIPHLQKPASHDRIKTNVKAGSLGAIVRAYKASVTFRVNAMRGYKKPFIWQRNYYEQIIGSEKEFENIWKYIQYNPDQWEQDSLHL